MVRVLLIHVLPWIGHHGMTREKESPSPVTQARPQATPDTQKSVSLRCRRQGFSRSTEKLDGASDINAKSEIVKVLGI